MPKDVKRCSVPTGRGEKIERAIRLRFGPILMGYRMSAGEK
jgi:hypothetical protein